MKHFQITFLFIFSFLLISTSFGQETNTITIFGKVSDEETGHPIPDANVFIANSMLGTASDERGRFVLKKVPMGTHILIVSNIAFKTSQRIVRIRWQKDKEINIGLVPRALQGPEIEVVAFSGDWKKYLKKFEQVFIGTSKNASACEIMNPGVLNFEENKGANLLTASANELLHIENRALGYRLDYLLESFNLHEGLMSYSGTAKFGEMDPEDEKQKETWRENRLRAYRGSLRHFLAALVSGRAVANGFLVSSLPELSDNLYSTQLDTVIWENLFSSGNLPSEKNLHFFDYLQVTYTEEMEERAYVFWRLNHDKSAITMTNRKLRESSQPQAQTSWLALNQTDVTVDTTGFLYDPLAVTVFGYWAWENVADLLPYEYRPE